MKTRVVLELGCNHQGEVRLAKRLIDEAAALRVWAVKLQKRDLASIPEELARQPRLPETSFGRTYLEHREALELPIEAHHELMLYARRSGLAFGLSVFDAPSCREALALCPDFVKLPSQLYADDELNALLRQASDGVLTMASTGMRQPHEVVSTRYFGRHDVTFFCRSAYPVAPEDLNLAGARWLFGALGHYNTVPGYSSHETGGQAIPLAVLLGARYVERHFTLNRAWKGADHGTVSSDVDEMRALMAAIERIEKIIGEVDAPLSPAELKTRRIYLGY